MDGSRSGRTEMEQVKRKYNGENLTKYTKKWCPSWCLGWCADCYHFLLVVRVVFKLVFGIVYGWFGFFLVLNI